MDTLNKDWLIEGHIDFEYKKYLVLAYLQSVEKKFENNTLYPYLRDIIQHYKFLLGLKENTETLSSRFPHNIQKIDFERLIIAYKKITQDDALMEELKSIIDFAAPQFARSIDEGKKIYDFIEGHIRIYPVGIVSLRPDEGYIFLRDNSDRNTEVFQYHITLYENEDDRFKAIHTSHITSYPRTIVYTMETIKNDLVKSKKGLPNPATYAIECEFAVPLNETFLPIAKHVLVRYVEAGNRNAG